jgi:methionine synthase I (cobalamin-dependent)
MRDLNEARAAVEGAQQAATVQSRALPVFCTFSFDTHGHTGMGIDPTQAAQAMDQMGVQATGANCGHAPEEVLAFLPQMRQAASDAFLIAKPNAGVPRMVDRQAVYDADPGRMADLARQFVELEARIVGACCGSSPEHIAAMALAVHKNGSSSR